MGEPYTDEELDGLVRNRTRRLMATIRRLQRERDEARRERDEARRVAQVLAKRCANGTIPRRDDLTRTAMAYPEVPHR